MMSEATEKKPAKVVLKELQDKIADDAWERIVSICTEEEEFGKLATLLEGSGVELVDVEYVKEKNLHFVHEVQHWLRDEFGEDHLKVRNYA